MKWEDSIIKTQGIFWKRNATCNNNGNNATCNNNGNNATCNNNGNNAATCNNNGNNATCNTMEIMRPATTEPPFVR
jgi:hypothetical protein